MPYTIVLKVGTSSIIDEQSLDVRYSLSMAWLLPWQTSAKLASESPLSVLVLLDSAGDMNFETRPASLSEKQVSQSVVNSEIWKVQFIEICMMCPRSHWTVRDDVHMVDRLCREVHCCDPNPVDSRGCFFGKQDPSAEALSPRILPVDQQSLYCICTVTTY